MPRTVVEALVALATQDGLGHSVDWAEVRAAVSQIQLDPVGPRKLRALLRRINNRDDIATTLEDWFIRAAAERREDAQAAARSANEILTPMQRVSLASAGGAGLAFALGSVAAPIAAPIALGALVVAGATGYGRWRLLRRVSEAEADADGMRRLAEIAHAAAAAG